MLKMSQRRRKRKLKQNKSCQKNKAGTSKENSSKLKKEKKHLKIAQEDQREQEGEKFLEKTLKMFKNLKTSRIHSKRSKNS